MHVSPVSEQYDPAELELVIVDTSFYAAGPMLMLLNTNIEGPRSGQTMLQFIEQRQPVPTRKSSGRCRPNPKRRGAESGSAMRFMLSSGEVGAALAPLEF